MSKNIQTSFSNACLSDIPVTPEEIEAFVELDAKLSGKKDQPATAIAEKGMTFEEYEGAVRQIQNRSSVSKSYNPNF